MQERLNQLALEIDNALSNKADLNQLNIFLQNIGKIGNENPNDFEKAQLNFYAANIYSHLKNIENENSEHLENEIYHLRLANTAFKLMPHEFHNTDLPYLIECNLANVLCYVGRGQEALENYNSVIDKFQYLIAPYGSEALVNAYGNKGKTLCEYAELIYDEKQVPYFYKFSHLAVKKALDLGVEKHAEEFYKNDLDYLNSLGDWDNMSVDTDKKLDCRSKKELHYRQWCLDNRLFLNPLNDVLKTANEVYDNLHIPPVMTPISDTHPEVYGIYNQLKQEYVSARCILFEAIEESEKHSVHFSDKKVYLVDMLDARFYRLWVEKMKMAFLAAYAIFDKIAFLINEYWQLGFPPDKTDFRKIWFGFELKEGNNGKINFQIKKEFNQKLKIDKNLSLNGLYWLSKDIHYKNDKRPTEPDAKQLYYIRNHISHKYLKVQHSSNNPASWRENNGHELTYPIDEAELQEQTIKLLKLVRSALIYVSLAVHCEEKQRRLNVESGLVAEMSMFHVEDNHRW